MEICEFKASEVLPVQLSKEISPVDSDDSGQGTASPVFDGPSGFEPVAHHHQTVDHVSHFFLFKKKYCSRFIGKKGFTINSLRKKSQCYINVTASSDPDHESEDLQKCVINGKKENLDKALCEIRKLFPTENFPDFSTEYPTKILPMSIQVSLQLDQELHRVTIVHVQDTGTIYIQKVSHPSHSSLADLVLNLNYVYEHCKAPSITSSSVLTDLICCAFYKGSWYRSRILSSDEDSQTCLVSFLDFGGEYQLPLRDLKHILDPKFVKLPFQVSKCYLSNIKPIDDTGYSTEGMEFLKKVTSRRVTEARVVSYADDSSAIIDLFGTKHNNSVHINVQLCVHNHAQWVKSQ